MPQHRVCSERWTCRTTTRKDEENQGHRTEEGDAKFPELDKRTRRAKRVSALAMDDQNQNENNPTGVDQWLVQADDFARREPTKAVVSAFGAGVLLNLLPIGAVVGVITAVAFSLIRPALLFLGLMKAFELGRAKLDSNQQP